MYDEITQIVINESFNGSAEAYEEARAHSTRKTLKWSDMVVAAKTLHDLELSAHKLIERLLGYLPPDYLTLPQESFLRALIQQYQSQYLSFEELVTQVEDHVKAIRNECVKSNSAISYDRLAYRKYFEYLPEKAEEAKARLTKFLGYEPKLEHSVVVEIILRESLIDDKFYFPDGLTTSDMEAITVVKYREVLLEHGKRAADASPLWATKIVEQYAAWSGK
jgi:hypothetical protein